MGFSSWFTKNGSGTRAGLQRPPASGRFEAATHANPVDDIHVWEFNPEDPESPRIQVVALMQVYDAICRQARVALPNETGGFLLGHVGRYERQDNAGWLVNWHLYINSIEPVQALETDPKHFTFSWRD